MTYTVNGKLKKTILKFQKNEMTEYYIYSRLAKRTKGENSRIFKKIASDEIKHYRTFRNFTGENVKANAFRVAFYLFLIKTIGITFGIRLMEKGENRTRAIYEKKLKGMPHILGILKDEFSHERSLMDMIDEEKMNYLSSMVLAVNNAIEELTGVVVGFTFALQNTKMIGISALITGIAATLSMAASEFLAQKSQDHDKNPLKAAFYTGVTYTLTMVLIVGPYFLFENYMYALYFALGIVVVIISLFALFMAVVKEISFKKSFIEVFLISAGVIAVSWGIGTAIRMVLLG